MQQIKIFGLEESFKKTLNTNLQQFKFLPTTIEMKKSREHLIEFYKVSVFVTSIPFIPPMAVTNVQKYKYTYFVFEEK